MPLALTSASPRSDVVAAYENNADYDLGGGLDHCRQFIQAARMLLRREVDEIENFGGTRVRDDYHKIEAQLNAALTWLRAVDPSAAAAEMADVTSLSFHDFRGGVPGPYPLRSDCDFD